MGSRNRVLLTVRPIAWVVLYFFAVFFGAALISPWIYHLTHELAEIFPALDGIAWNPFHRYLNRSLLLGGIIGLWPFLCAVGLNNWRSLGLGTDPEAWRRFGQGLLIGFASLACGAMFAIAAGAREFVPYSMLTMAGHLLSAAIAALVVSVLEELLFRGTLFGALRQAMNWPSALIVSSGIYALLHFFQRPAEPETIHWATGFLVLGEMFHGFVDWPNVLPAALNLVLAGMILGWVYQRFGTLHFSIGLHAGWIFWLKSYGLMTSGIPGANTPLWGTRKLIDGWLAFVILGLILFGIRRAFPIARGNSSATAPNER